MAFKNARRWSGEEVWDMFSQPSGRPWLLGNGISLRCMWECWETYGFMERAFEGVVMIVILRPRRESAFERSRSGMVWP